LATLADAAGRPLAWINVEVLPADQGHLRPVANACNSFEVVELINPESPTTASFQLKPQPPM
jgi:hypothetical protein